ncbi:MAG: DUF402 domain-containing protein [Clostridia bacterium]|nr:DUF402 domain-containing protein [Clostridia bacterium]
MSLSDRGMYRREFNRIKKSQLLFKRIASCDFCGYAGLLYIVETDGEWKVKSALGEAVIAAPGYIWLQLSPDCGGWWLTAMYDTSGNHVQYYFDVTDKNYFSADGEPRFIDLYLDIVVNSNGDITLLDEDELESAFRKGVITKRQYDAAIETARSIMKNVSGRLSELRDFCMRIKEQIQ